MNWIIEESLIEKNTLLINLDNLMLYIK
jgi:hypothetical protein